MAEDTDNTKKPKAQLIKHSQNETEKPAEKLKAEQSENNEAKAARKVVVVKKKSAPPAAPKKMQPKIVVSTPAAKEPAVQTSDDKSAPNAEEPKEKPENNAPKTNTFSFNQRPAAAAGRVGGKLVGQSKENFSQRQPRPQGSSHGGGQGQGRSGGGYSRPQGSSHGGQHGSHGGGEGGRSGGFNRPQGQGSQHGSPHRGSLPDKAAFSVLRAARMVRLKAAVLTVLKGGTARELELLPARRRLKAKRPASGNLSLKNLFTTAKKKNLKWRKNSFKPRKK